MLGVNTIKITPEILNQISDIDEFKGLWTGLERHTTGLNLLGDVADHGKDFGKVLKALEKQPLTVDIINVINANQLGQKGASELKVKSNQLPISSDSKVFGTLDTAEPEQVLPVLTKLCEWTNRALAERRLHPLLVIAVFASVFMQLSPHDTGNLRTVRFLVMLMMLKSGYAYAPYVSLASMMEERALGFYNALKHNQDALEAGAPDWSEWLNWFLGLLQKQKDILYARLYEKEAELQNLPALSARVMELFKEHSRLQMKQIIKLTNGRRATLKLRLQELVEGGYLKRHGQARSTWYSLN